MFPLFILDTNVFVEAHRRYYAQDICPGFWKCLAHYSQEGRVLSIDRVRNEILNPSTLVDWVRQAPDGLFVSSSEQSVAGKYKEIMDWVQGNKQFRTDAKKEFARGADGWAAAYAKAHDAVLVTHEAFHPDAKKRVPLPNVCIQFRISYKNTFEMLRELEAVFDWARPAAATAPRD